jgi:hypothetical protein
MRGKKRVKRTKVTPDQAFEQNPQLYIAMMEANAAFIEGLDPQDVMLLSIVGWMYA